MQTYNYNEGYDMMNMLLLVYMNKAAPVKCEKASIVFIFGKYQTIKTLNLNPGYYFNSGSLIQI